MEELAITLSKDIDKAISKKDINLYMLTKIKAINALCAMLVINGDNNNIDIIQAKKSIICLYAYDMPFYFYVAHSMILNLVFPRWKECVSEEILGKIVTRRSGDLRKWKLEVFKRDSYICVECGSKNKLHAHHILNWAEYPQYRVKIDNGVTLCNECHADKHPELARGFVL